MTPPPSRWPLPPGSAATDFPVPDGLNRRLAALSFVAATGLLWLGSRRPEWWWAFGCGIPFSYVMLLVYALMHQGMHDSLQSDPGNNYRLGVFVSLLFPAPFSMVWTTHQGHHMRNRTDHEMFDLYYPTNLGQNGFQHPVHTWGNGTVPSPAITRFS